jgi:hypothetical protein
MTWDGLLAYCVSVIGLTPTIYWQSTFSQVVQYVREFNQRSEKIQRYAWERTRWQTTALLNVHAKKGKQIKPTDLIEFPWEQKKKVKAKKLSKTEVHETYGRMDRDYRKWYEEQQKAK